MQSRYLFILFILSQNFAISQQQFTKTIIADSLEDPWSIVYGPDDHLWLTEAKGYRVLRIDPSTKNCDTILDLNAQRLFPRYDTLKDPNHESGNSKPWPQGGLMGIALHPKLLTGKPFVYLAYVYDYEGKSRAGNGENPVDGGFHFNTRIVCYSYDPGTKKLTDPRIMCDSLPGSNDHNGGRLVIASVDTIPYLFYSIGDMGAGQYKNGARKNHAQDPNFYEGKILRFYTEPVTGKDSLPVWMPLDNPFTLSKPNAAWTIGHRNPQGLTVMHKRGKDQLIASEHGPFSDDEINVIQRSGNYGHPKVIGYADGNYNGLAAGVTAVDSLEGAWNTAYPLIVNEKDNAAQIRNYTEPIFSFNPTINRKLFKVAKKLKRGARKEPAWKSLAPSGLAAYDSDAIPGWKNSILVTSLKQGKIVRLKLNDELTKVTEQEELFKQPARYRDITVSADGQKIYVTTDKSTVTSGPTQKRRSKQSIHGAVIEYKVY